LVIAEIADGRPRRELREEQRLDLEDVADPRDDALIEERRRDVAVLLLAESAQRLVRIELIADDVRSKATDDAMQSELLRGEELDDRRMEARRDDVRGADDDARLLLRLPPPFAGAIDVPRAAHLHVRVQHDLMRRVEVDEEVLAVRLDGLHGATHDLITANRGAHLGRVDVKSRYQLAREHATEHRGRAED